MIFLVNNLLIYFCLLLDAGGIKQPACPRAYCVVICVYKSVMSLCVRL